MTEKLLVRKEPREGGFRVTVEGGLDEDANLLARLEGMSGKIRFHLKGVDRINSCGVREWMTAIQELEKSCEIEFEEVSVPIVQQFNMVLNARGNGRVLSFYAPYHCANCDRDVETLINPEANPDCFGNPDALSAPELACEKCSSPLEFDEISEEYFYFLETQLRERT